MSGASDSELELRSSSGSGLLLMKKSIGSASCVSVACVVAPLAIPSTAVFTLEIDSVMVSKRVVKVLDKSVKRSTAVMILPIISVKETTREPMERDILPISSLREFNFASSFT